MNNIREAFNKDPVEDFEPAHTNEDDDCVLRALEAACGVPDATFGWDEFDGTVHWTSIYDPANADSHSDVRARLAALFGLPQEREDSQWSRVGLPEILSKFSGDVALEGLWPEYVKEDRRE